MRKNKSRPKWETPQLIAMVKGEQQESVLVSCKNASGGNAGFGFVIGSACWGGMVTACNIAPCAAIVPS
jgi:hypothetical protein